MQPFGWLLVERADAHALPDLREWCQAQQKPDLSTVRARLIEARAQYQDRLKRLRQAELEQEARREEERRAHEAHSARLASLSEEGRHIEALRERLQAHVGRKQPLGGSLYEQTRKLLRAALDTPWAEGDRRDLADLVEALAFEKIDFGGRAKEIKQMVSQLRGQI
jgi:hypothetical protein